MAFLEFARGNYYSRLWFLGGPSDAIDVLMALSRTLPDGDWTLKYRIRRKVDEKTFGSEDTKTFWSATFPAGMTEAEAVRKVGPVLQKLRAMTRLPVDVTTIESDDPALIVHLLQGKSFMHVKYEKVEEGN